MQDTLSLSPRGVHFGSPTRFDVTIDDDGLRFGNDAILAQMSGPQHARRPDLVADRERLLALLSVVARCPLSTEVLLPFEIAARLWERGDKALANLRLVFAGLPRLDDPADAARVSLAAYCLDQGMAPRALMKELGLDTAVLDVIKYDPSQPREPAGSGAQSGRWTSGSTDRALVAPLPSLLAETSPEILAALTRFASRFSVPTAVLGALIIPTPNDGGVTTGVLPNAPDILFRKDDPRGLLSLTTKASDGTDVTVVALSKQGLYLNLEGGGALGRNLGGQLYLDLDAVHDAIDDASPKAAQAEPDERPKAATDEPKLCPAPTPDTPHGASKRANDYEDDVHARVNPLAPLPRGFGVKLFNPVTGKDVFFEDCFRYAGDLVDRDMHPGAVVEAKGPRTAYLYSKDWKTLDADIEQATKQLQAADARGVGLKWYYAEQEAAEKARDAFDKRGLERVVIGVMPPRRQQ